MFLEQELKQKIKTTIQEELKVDLPLAKIILQPTKSEFSGDVTLLVFGLAPLLKLKPEEACIAIGNALLKDTATFTNYEVVKGFLNLLLSKQLYLQQLNDKLTQIPASEHAQHVVIEYSSPNTNKPLHLGHMRNILLGYALTRVVAAVGNKVSKVNIVNDRGIHICKSMLAWQLYGNNETPLSSGLKGDKLVGKYYVEFDKVYQQQAKELLKEWSAGNFANEQLKNKYDALQLKATNAEKPEAKEKAEGELKELAKAETTIFKQAQQMLRNWEAGDEAVLTLWKKMNGWVYDGMDVTYKTLGVEFDKIYYESDTYLLGKKMVEEGLAKNIFYQKEDGSIWVDLTDEKLDHKLLLRSDGTSVYITQDLGTAMLRQQDFHFDKMIYVVGNEQEYHFKVLRLVFKKLGYAWWHDMIHFSYNMVDLTSGRMKSREGTVVDADDLIQETIDAAAAVTRELGKTNDMTETETMQLYYNIGMGALKFYLLKVDPEKRILFDPTESIDINGFTGPFVQYTYARIKSVLRKAALDDGFSKFQNQNFENYPVDKKEFTLVKILVDYPTIVQQAADKLSPAIIANYAYEVAKVYNQFYHDHVVIDITQLETSKFRLQLSNQTAQVLKASFYLLGIDMPERM